MSGMMNDRKDSTQLSTAERDGFMSLIQYDYYNRSENFVEDIELFSHSIWDIISNMLQFSVLLIPYVAHKVLINGASLTSRCVKFTTSKKKDPENVRTGRKLECTKQANTSNSDLTRLHKALQDDHPCLESGEFHFKSTSHKLRYLYVLVLHAYRRQPEERQCLILAPFVLLQISVIVNLYHYLFGHCAYKFHWLACASYWLLLGALWLELLLSTSCALLFNAKFDAFSTWEGTVEAFAAVVGTFAPAIYAVATDRVDGPAADWFLPVAVYVLQVAVNRHLGTLLFNGLMPRSLGGVPCWKGTTVLGADDELQLEAGWVDVQRLSRKLAVAHLLLRAKAVAGSASCCLLCLLCYAVPVAPTACYAYVFQLTAILVLANLNAVWLVKYFNDLVGNFEATHEQRGGSESGESVTGGSVSVCCECVVDRRYYALAALLCGLCYLLRGYRSFNVWEL